MVQRFLVCSKASVCETSLALARFTARFSFRDLPDFWVIVFRGDLSDITALLKWGPVLVPLHRVYAPSARVAHICARVPSIEVPATPVCRADGAVVRPAIRAANSLPRGMEQGGAAAADQPLILVWLLQMLTRVCPSRHPGSWRRFLRTPNAQRILADESPQRSRIHRLC